MKEAQRLLLTYSKFPCWEQQLNLFLDTTRLLGPIIKCRLTIFGKIPNPSIQESLLHFTCHSQSSWESAPQYWIISGRSTVRATLRRCVTCRKAEGKPYLAPLPSPLPKFRVRKHYPLLDPCMSRRQEQHPGNCLYTCVVRAVHLNVVPDLTTASFIRSFKRFTVRHGLPTWMVSDNGK